MANGALDTNALLDWLLVRDPRRFQLVERLLRSGKRFYVVDLVIIEFVFALERTYKLTRSDIATDLLIILDAPQLICHDEHLRGTVARYLTHPSLSFVDCYLIETTDPKGALPLWTFDKKLVNQSNGRAKLLK